MNITDHDPFNTGGAFGNGSRQGDSSSPYGTEHRKEPRFRVGWKIVLAIKGGDTHEGQAKDISPSGASVLIERNIKSSTKVTLSIDIPSLSGHGKARTIIAHGRIVYTVHDVEKLTFRAGIQFEKFDLPSDRSYLEARLKENHLPLR